MQKNKENFSIEVYGGGGLELARQARESASSRHKSCASLKNASGMLPVRRSLLVLAGRKHTMVIDKLPPQIPPGSRL